MTSQQTWIENYLSDAAEIAARLDAHAVSNVVDHLYSAWQRDAAVYLFGNGGSASTAQHLAADLSKCTVVTGKPRLRAKCLNDNLPLVSALTNDDGWDAIYVEQLRSWWRPGDVAFGISVHGGVGSDRAGPWSQNVVTALRHAREHAGVALGFAGCDGGAMVEVCDAVVVVPAESTPHVEGMHVVLHHLVTAALARRIEDS